MLKVEFYKYNIQRRNYFSTPSANISNGKVRFTNLKNIQHTCLLMNLFKTFRLNVQ